MYYYRLEYYFCLGRMGLVLKKTQETQIENKNYYL